MSLLQNRTKKDLNWLTIHTDASYRPLSESAFCAGWIRTSNGRTKFQKSCPETIRDNNHAEMYAIVYALLIAKEHWEKYEKGSPSGVTIRTDSMHSIGRFTSPEPKPKWDAINVRLHKFFHERITWIPKFKFMHVKGHQKDVLDQSTYINKWCDKRAKIGGDSIQTHILKPDASPVMDMEM